MRTFLTIAVREFTSLIRDGRFIVTCTLFAALMAASVYIGIRDFRARDEVQLRLTAQVRNQWEGQKSKDPHSAGHFGMYVIKPSGSVSWLEPGIEPYLGSIGFLEPHVRNELVHRPASETTSIRHFGYFSPAFLLQVVGSLIVILFTFASFSGDRESGILRLTLATGVSSSAVVGGKIVANLAATAALISPSLVAASVLMTRGGQTFDFPRIGLMFAGYSLFYISIAAMTLWVSSLSLRSQVSLATMIIFWVLTSFVIPRTVSDFAASRNPLPSKAAFADRIARETLNGIDGHDPADVRRGALLAKTLKEFGVSRVEDLPVNFDAVALQASEDYTSELYQREFDSVAQKLFAQSSTSRMAALVAPYLAIREWSMAIAGTDYHHFYRFGQSAEDYRQKLIRKLNTDMIENSRTGEYSYMVEEKFWKSVPAFRYQEPDLIWSVNHAWLPFGALFGWTVVCIGLCARSAATLRS